MNLRLLDALVWTIGLLVQLAIMYAVIGWTRPCDYDGGGYYDLLDVQAFQNCWMEEEG